jgi:hypothetical protein
VKEITIEIESENELWSLFDKKNDYIFIHRFNPNETIKWWKSDIKIKPDFGFKNLSVRNMKFDLQTDLTGLKEILKLQTRQLSVYQFDRPVPDTLCIEMLPDESIDNILKQNGLKHKYMIDYEFVTVYSFDEKFIKSIIENKKTGYNKL